MFDDYEYVPFEYVISHHLQLNNKKALKLHYLGFELDRHYGVYPTEHPKMFIKNI